MNASAIEWTPMKTITRQALLWASLAVLALPAVVQAQFKCKTNSDSTITITGYIGEPVLPSGALTIPSTINGLPVTGIGSYSFEYCYSLTQCTLPDRVTNIADSAFYGTGIVSITIPANVIYIGKDAFFYCNSLANISVNPSNSAYSSLNGVLLSKDQTTLVEYPNGIVLPSSGTRRCSTTPLLACRRTASVSPLPTLAAQLSWWKPARI